MCESLNMYVCESMCAYMFIYMSVYVYMHRWTYTCVYVSIYLSFYLRVLINKKMENYEPQSGSSFAPGGPEEKQMPLCT